MAKYRNTEQQRINIIESIDTLLYQKGFNNMSFNDIAKSTGLSKGNLYYYFKTKQDVLTAVIDFRIENIKKMLNDWETTIVTPLERLQRFVQIINNEADHVIKYGCPMGSLNIELAKSQPDLQKISKQQFDVFKTWLKKQLKLMIPDKDVEQLSIQLLARTQGVAAIAQAYKDKKIISREVEQIQIWLGNLLSND